MAKQISVRDNRLPISLIIGAARFAQEDAVFSRDDHRPAIWKYYAPVSYNWGDGVIIATHHGHNYVFNTDVESAVSQTAAREFTELRQQWIEERGATSSITEMVMCRSHLRIIGLGRIAIPLILRQMEAEGAEPDMWFVVLQILTGADPVTDEIRGDFSAMARRWLDWAAANGYAW